MKKLLISILVFACSDVLAEPTITISQLNRTLVDVLVKDQFSPPVASRIHAYCNLAYYEVLNAGDSKATFLSHIDGLPVITPDKLSRAGRDIAAIVSFIHVAEELTFSKSEWKELKSKIAANTEDNNGMNKALENYTPWYAKYMEWVKADNYAERLAKEKYTASNSPEAYKLTPPSFKAPMEPYWGTIRGFLTHPDSFSVENVMTFDTAKASAFYKSNEAIYNESKNFTEEQTEIAFHWDDNPVQIKSLGHAMLYSFRMTPPSHWVLCAADIIDEKKIEEHEAARIFTGMSLAMADAFIRCWRDKYEYNTIRPVTYIHRYINDDWHPILETPIFPEYPSGHSYVSAAAAAVLTMYLGENYAFVDQTQEEYGSPSRAYNSFYEAALEAGESRYYGGIHYHESIDLAFDAGKEMGNYICGVLRKISE